MNYRLIFLSVFAFGILVCSCSEDKPEEILPGPINDSKIYSYTMTAPAGATVTLEKTMKLEDFTALGVYVKNVYQGVLNTNSYIEFVKNTAESIQLENVTLQVKGNSKIKYNLGTLSHSFRFISLDELNFLQLVINEMVDKKEIILQLSYQSKNAMTSEVNLNLRSDITFKLR